MALTPHTGTFTDSTLEQRFRQDGYVRIKLLDESSVLQLTEAFASLKGSVSSAFHATMLSEESDYRRQVRAQIASVIAPLLPQHLSGYRLCVANFLYKAPQASDSEVPLHLDWSFVDETQHRAIHIWCPLVDTDLENGCLAVFPGTHRLSHRDRAHSDPHPFALVERELRSSNLREEPIPSGEALFYDGALLHGSRANRSPSPRLCVGCVLVPREAALIHCLRVSPRDVERFAVDDDFFLSHIPGSRPTGYPSIGTVPSELRELGLGEIASLLEGRGGPLAPGGVRLR